VDGDGELVAAFLAGERAALTTVQEWIGRAAAPYRRRLAEDWEDVLQQALLDLTTDLRAGRFRGAGSLRGYLWRSVNHTCLDRLRRARRWRWEPLDECEPQAPSPSPFAVAARRQTARRVLALLSTMPDHCRELWAMILDGLSYQDMGRRLELAEGTLRVRVLRCRRQAIARWREVTNPEPRRRVSQESGGGDGH
jgi:RNA polymerase sigma factor (sigma-70 family)